MFRRLRAARELLQELTPAEVRRTVGEAPEEAWPVEPDVVEAVLAMIEFKAGPTGDGAKTALRALRLLKARE